MSAVPLTKYGPDKGGNYEYQWKGQFLEAHFLSDIGKQREHNEDCCILCAPEDASLVQDRGILFAVADGMGGASAGEFASRLALQTLCEEYFSGSRKGIPAGLVRAVERANRRIYEEAESNPQYQGMGTTISAVLVRGHWAYVAQVGDSRVYVARDKAVQQITDDHSLVAEQLRNGYITEQEARNHSLKNLITRAVGIKDEVAIDLFTIHIKKDDTILLCSDGLSNMVLDDEIARSLAIDNVQGACRVLVGRALEEGGNDNVTVAVVRVTEQPPKAELDEGGTEITIAPPGLLGKLKKLIK